MDSIVIVAILVGIAEVYMILYSGFHLVGVRPDKVQLFWASVSVSLLVRAARYLLYSVLSAPFGLHILVSVVALSAVGFLWFKEPIVTSMLAALVGYMLLLLGTMLVFFLAPNIKTHGFITTVGLIAVEESPLLIATLFIWKTDYSIVPRRVARSLRG